jgi:hypothetical protein
MKTSILHAINNIIENKLYNINTYKNSNYKIKINTVGEKLENFVKDALCGTFHLNEKEKIELYSEYFSYIGNQNNPPDFIINNSDAFEIKKIESNASLIALNSSFPKNKLYRSSNMITNSCKNCENDYWQEKDICYIIGSIDNYQSIKNLWFVYGDCYCAQPEIYEDIKNKISSNIQELSIELTKTNEIAKIKNIDPLGITDLRIRSMWTIKHPSKVFHYIIGKQTNSYIRAIMLKSKFQSFDQEITNQIIRKCNVQNVKIPNPNNPANLLDAILIEYQF